MNFEQKCLEKLKQMNVDFRQDIDAKTLRALNKIARESDTPHLFPYVHAADSAIRWYSRVYFRANGACSNLEYIVGLEHKMGEVVNKH